MVEAVLACSCVEMSFGGVPVLNSVSLDLEPGTVTALAGENGAGKSTLMKIISGQYRPDKGNVIVDGHPLHGGPLRGGQIGEAHRLGVAIVPQELASIPHLSVYENIFIGREIRKAGWLDRRAMIKAATTALAEFEVDIKATSKMAALPVGLQQIVEIVKATMAGARVLLLDEPTSAIAEREVEGLYRVVRRLRDRGVAMVYTTHKMEEIRALADRVVVLRDGDLVLDQPMDTCDDEAIVTAMIGRELGTLFPPVAAASAEPVLEVTGLQVRGAEAPVSLTVRAGEIVGLAGLVGAGRTELVETIFGVRRRLGGQVSVAGKPVPPKSPSASINAGMALVPEDRKGAGAFLGLSVLDNASMPRLTQFSTAGWLHGRSRSTSVNDAMRSVRLLSRGLRQEVGTLSGGNQQKVVLARWLAAGEVSVLLLDEPTRGVDIGARAEIYRIVAELASRGMAVIMVSSDMPEILGLAHRALVLRAGMVIGELDRTDLDHPLAQARIFALAANLKEGSQS